ncbi:MAG: hypothetical protein ACRCZQ_02070, partial [Bacteroidales bacterium]
FMYQLLDYLGLSPKISKETSGYFILDKGVIESTKPTYGAFLNEEQTVLLVLISQYSFREMKLVKLSRQQRNILTDAMLGYLRYHLNNHAVLNSFDVLRELFE